MSWQGIEERLSKKSDKTSWERELGVIFPHPRTIPKAKELKGIVDLLLRDELSVYYSPKIWCNLLEFAIEICENNTADRLCEVSKSVQNLDVLSLRVRYLVDRGKSIEALNELQKLLRRKHIGANTKKSLLWKKCLCLCALGRRTHAIQLHKTISQVATADPYERLLIYEDGGRVAFWLADYELSFERFTKAYHIYLANKRWAEAASAAFNAAAAIDNALSSTQVLSPEKLSLGREWLSRCIELSETYRLRKQRAACSGYLGVEESNRGNLKYAERHLKEAIKLSREKESSIRCIHLHSLRCQVLQQIGDMKRAEQARKKLLSILDLGDSEAFAQRCQMLNSIALWQKGKFLEAYSLSRHACRKAIQAPPTLDRCQLIYTYLEQCIFLCLKVDKRLEDIIQSNVVTRAMLSILQNKYQSALEDLNVAIQQTGVSGIFVSQYYFWKTLCLLNLRKNQTEIDTSYRNGLKLAQDSKANCLLARYYLLKIAITYQKGEWIEIPKSIKQITQKEKSLGHSLPEKLVLDTWRLTCVGKIGIPKERQQVYFVVSVTNLLIKPRINYREAKVFELGSHSKIEINLSSHPTCAKVLSVILKCNNSEISLEHLFKIAWDQERLVGDWRQRVRNTLHRLRKHTPLSLMPLCVERDGFVYNLVQDKLPVIYDIRRKQIS